MHVNMIRKPACEPEKAFKERSPDNYPSVKNHRSTASLYKGGRLVTWFDLGQQIGFNRRPTLARHHTDTKAALLLC